MFSVKHILIFLLVSNSLASSIPDNYQPHFPGYLTCLDHVNLDIKLSCLEETISGLQALSLHRNGEDGAEITNNLSIKECGGNRSLDALLCRVRVIDFWIH